MKKTGIIAFCGSKGAGKSTSFGLFSEVSGLTTEEIAIAGHLKEACSRVFDINMKYFIDPSLKEVELEDYIILNATTLGAVLREFDVVDYTHDLHIRPHISKVLYTPRSLLQYIGTEVLHPIDPLIHVKKAIKKKNPDNLTVITDLRFEAEFNYFKDNVSDTFVPVYIKNSRAELTAASDAHPSERQLELFKNKCYLLNNEGNIQELKENIRALYETVYR